MATPTTITNITSTSDFDKLLAENQYVVTDFWAEWCGPCKAMGPIFGQHAAAHAVPGRVAFAKVDVDAAPEVAARYSVRAIPTFLFVRDGQVYDEIKQANPPKLKAAVEGIAAEMAKGAGGEEGGNDISKAIEDENW